MTTQELEAPKLSKESQWIVQTIGKQCNFVAGAKVGDIFCKEAQRAHALAQLGYEVYGFITESERYQLALEHHNHKLLTWISTPNQEVNFPTESLDVVVAVNLFNRERDVRQTIGWVSDFVAKQGHMIFLCDNKAALHHPFKSALRGVLSNLSEDTSKNSHSSAAFRLEEFPKLVPKNCQLKDLGFLNEMMLQSEKTQSGSLFNPFSLAKSTLQLVGDLPIISDRTAGRLFLILQKVQ